MRVLAAGGIEFEREIPFGVAGELFAAHLASGAEGERERLLAGHAALAASLFDPAAPAPEDAQAFVRGLYWLTVNLALPPRASDARPLYRDRRRALVRSPVAGLSGLPGRASGGAADRVAACGAQRRAASSAAMLDALRDRAGHRVLARASERATPSGGWSGPSFPIPNRRSSARAPESAAAIRSWRTN